MKIISSCFIFFILMSAFIFTSFSIVLASGDSYVGRSTCDLDFSFRTGMFRLPIENAKSEHAIELREIHQQKYLFLVNNIKEIGGCGTIISEFHLPRMKLGESVEFNCKTKNQSRDTKDIVVGVGMNNSGKKTFVRPRLAWGLDLNKMQFVQRTTSDIICDTRGYR